MKTIAFFLLSVSSILFSQHSVPFASSKNVIELAVANSSIVAASNVVIEVTSVPQWLRINNDKYKIENLNANESNTAQFAFSVDKSAPVNKLEQVTFIIWNSDGQVWTKTLSLQVSPPEKFELFQNYPNPFNPTTTISYQLPALSNISIKIYDITGREVTTLFEGVSEAGYHQYEWNARNVASGMYIYQLTLNSEQGKSKHYRKKMLVVK